MFRETAGTSNNKENQSMGVIPMGRNAFLREWKIRWSGTPFLSNGDRLTIKKGRGSYKVKFTCDSKSKESGACWKSVGDCRWHQHGGEHGFLCGTIANGHGESFPFVATFKKVSKPNPGDRHFIRFEFVGQPSGSEGSGHAAPPTMDGGGANGDDDEN